MKDLWNILEKPWIDVSAVDGAWWLRSPLDVLKEAATLRRIAASSPLDEFAIHRFLTTLLYWKADAVGGLEALRRTLLAGTVPPALIVELAAERDHFNLFDPDRPFLQDPAAADAEPTKPVGSLFAEIATGTNIAHFDHSRDMKSPLCIPCVVRGLLRLVPWTQSGGAGLLPSIHGAPPIAVIPRGTTLARTLGLSLVALPSPLGKPVWSGAFHPSSFVGAIPVLEAFTWNPRRVHVPAPLTDGRCRLCGGRGLLVPGITFKKNEAVKRPKDDGGKAPPLDWRDPAFIYSEKYPETIKSSSESSAATAEDLRFLHREPPGSESAATFTIVVPCTNPANNKTFDHRRLEVGAIADLPQHRPPHHAADPRSLMAEPLPDRSVGWRGTSVTPSVRTAIRRFVTIAIDALNDADWILLHRAIGRPMNEDAEAFAVFSAVFWRARGGGRPQLRREAAWMLLKLMALAPSGFRVVAPDAQVGSLLDALPTKQASSTRSAQSDAEPYPLAPPRGHALEVALAAAVQIQVARGTALPWVELGAFLHNSSR